MTTTTLSISGMHCPACVRRVTEALQKVPGVRTAHVTLTPPEARIQTEGLVPLFELEQATRTAGDYSATLIGSPSSAATGHQHQSAAPKSNPSAPKPSLYPLILIVAYIAGTCALTAYVRAGWTWHDFMLDFMAGFFLVFSFFKLLDMRGFADAYQSYDILARPFRPWAFAYPFVELALGIAYLIRWERTLTNGVTLALMLLGSVGVLQALLNKKAIRCACLGTALNLPMTTVTLVEDLGMAAMATAALLWSH